MKRIGLAMILALAATAQAENIGRLFFTPEQRILLDNARGQKVKIEVEEQTAEPAPDIVSLNGMVRRDDGHTTVWLNNRAVSDRTTTGGVTILPQGTASDPVLFTMPQTDRAISLRVGQNLDVTTGQVVEPYSPKAAEMKRALAEKQQEPEQAHRTQEGQAPQQGNAGTNANPAPSWNSVGAATARGTPPSTPAAGAPRNTISPDKPSR